MEKIKGITLYGASRSDIDSRYLEEAFELGRLIAQSSLPLICGGGRGGLMAAAIDGALSEGGMTIGVLPQFMIDRNWQHEKLGQLIVTPDMHTRKHTMASMSRAAIAMPGGIGTLEELLEIITWRQLEIYDGNVVMLNTLNYYDPLLGVLTAARTKGFMRGDNDHLLWKVASTPADALAMALSTTDKDH